MLRSLFALLAIVSILLSTAAAQPAPAAKAAEQPIQVLLIDGQNNHAWQQTTPAIQQTLEGTGLFAVTVATSPPQGSDMSGFAPRFADYDVVLSNYNGDLWSAATRQAFEKYVSGGGGFVAVHAANNAFAGWDAYNRMIGLGGWGGRTEQHGPYVRWQDDLGRFTRDTSPGSGGTHGRRTPFLVVVRDSDHPITHGLPKSWMQAEDELYGKLRGPAENMHVLATAYSEPATGGTGEHEPILMTVHFGNGRVFHTTLGHDLTAISGLAFQVTLQRGTQWAATGQVTLPPVSAKELTSDAPATRAPETIAPSADSAAVDFETIPDPQTGKWKSLFDGSSLTGWTQKNGTASYRVEEGAIVGKTATGSPNSFLCSEETYGDFELIFEVDCDPQLNSGVQIRSRSTAEFNNGRVHGIDPQEGPYQVRWRKLRIRPL